MSAGGRNGGGGPARHDGAKDLHAYQVAGHYNARGDRGKLARFSSPIFHMKNLNNWIKSVLISECRADINGKIDVLDLCCGKGGDLLKFQKANTQSWMGVDVAYSSVRDALNRYNPKNARFPAAFVCADCTEVRLKDHMRVATPFNLVNCQMALHYSWESEAQARCLLQNASDMLRPGGCFLGTIPNANLIVKTLRSTNELKFGNSVFSVEFDKEIDTSSPFGSRYTFWLDGAIDHCDEYLVHLPTFERLAKEVGLRLLYTMDFHAFVNQHINTKPYRDLMRTIKVFNEKGTLSVDEWQALGVYLVFAFVKEGPIEHPRNVATPDPAIWKTNVREEDIFVLGRTAIAQRDDLRRASNTQQSR